MFLNKPSIEGVLQHPANDSVMDAFEYHANPARVIFGRGSINKLPDELNRLGLSKPLLLSTAQQVQQVQQLGFVLENRGTGYAGTYANATMCEIRVSIKPERSIG